MCYHFHARKMPALECLVTMTTRVPEATLGKAVEDIRGRPRHPAKALAANHSDQVTLIHLAATEADSKNG
jgi:muconolactone delta-isomerase